jgi:hypothetical protein
MSNSDDGGNSRKAAIVKLLDHIEKSWEACSPPEYGKSVSESQRSPSRENENQKQKGGVIQEITVKDNSSDLSDPPHHHDHKATRWSSSGEQADDEDSGQDSTIEDSTSRFSGDKKEGSLKKLLSSDEEMETQPSQHQVENGAPWMSPKSSVSRSSSSSAGSSRPEEEQQFVVADNDFVVAIDDRYTVLPRVGTHFRGRFTPGCGSMPPPWSPMEQQQREASSRHFDQPDNVQNDSPGSRRRKREGEKS